MPECDHIRDDLTTGPDGECLLCVREERARQRESASSPSNAAQATTGGVFDLKVPVDDRNPSPAVVHEWLVHPGETLEPGTPVVVLDRSGLRETLVSPIAGTLSIHKARPGMTVPPNFTLVKMLPLQARQAVEKGDWLSPANQPPEHPATTAEPPAPDVEEPPVEAIQAEEPAATDQPANEPDAEATHEGEPPNQPAEEPVVEAQPQPAAPEPDAILFPPDPPPPEDVPEGLNTGLGDAGISEEMQVIDELKKLREQRVFVVSLIGFYEGGKTWFLNRLKNVLEGRGVWVRPPAAKNGTRVSRTNNFSVHRFTSKSALGGRPQEFAIIDLPGETVRSLVENPLLGPRALLATLNASGALIVALPADEVLLSGYAAEAKQLLDMDALPAGLTRLERERAERIGKGVADPAYRQRLDRLAEADELITSFTNELCNLTALLSTMRAKGIQLDAAPSEANIDRDEINLHVRSGQFVPFRTPTFIALTKADRITHPDAVGADLLHGEDADLLTEMQRDPRQLVIEHRESLAALLDHWFDRHKFDFVGAFEGHSGDMVINYRRPYRGVRGVINWLSWVRRTTPPNKRQWNAMQLARGVRMLRDGRISEMLDAIGNQDDRPYG